MPNLPFRFEEIDLKATARDGGAGLMEGPQYLVLYSGELHLVRFKKMWFGLSSPVVGPYRPPGDSESKWQRMWLITMNDLTE